MARKSGDGCRGKAIEARAFALAACGSCEARVWLEVASAWEAAGMVLDAVDAASWGLAGAIDADTGGRATARARQLDRRAMAVAA